MIAKAFTNDGLRSQTNEFLSQAHLLQAGTSWGSGEHVRVQVETNLVDSQTL